MKIKSSLLLLSCIACLSLKAKISKDDFDKAVDYTICKIIYQAIRESQTLTSKNFTAACNCQNNTYSYTIKTIQTGLQKSEEDATDQTEFTKIDDLLTELSGIHENYEKLEEKDAVVEMLSNNIFSNPKYSILNNYEFERIEDLKSTIQTGLSSLLADKNGNRITINDLNDSIIKYRNEVQTLNNNITHSNFSFLTVFFSILLSIIAVIITLKVRKSVNSAKQLDLEKNEDQNVEIVSNQNTKFGNKNSVTISKLDKELKTLKEQFDKFKAKNYETVEKELKSYMNSEIEKLRDLLSVKIGNSIKDLIELKGDVNLLRERFNKESSSLQTNASNIPLDIIVPEQEIKNGNSFTESVVNQIGDEFFLSTPNSDGSFNESSALPVYKEGASVYRFVKTGPNKAKFTIDEREASIKLALQYPDKVIDPVCDESNSFSSRAKRIITEEPGRVELEGTKWMIKQKAKIRYDS